MATITDIENAISITIDTYIANNQQAKDIISKANAEAKSARKNYRNTSGKTYEVIARKQTSKEGKKLIAQLQTKKQKTYSKKGIEKKDKNKIIIINSRELTKIIELPVYEVIREVKGKLQKTRKFLDKLNWESVQLVIPEEKIKNNTITINIDEKNLNKLSKIVKTTWLKKQGGD